MMMEFGNVREILDLGSFELTGWHTLYNNVQCICQYGQDVQTLFQ